MEGQKQLLSEETGSECIGIDAPSLVQQNITADEMESTENESNETQLVVPEEASSTERNQCEKTKTDEIEVKLELSENKQEEETPINDITTEGDNSTLAKNDKGKTDNKLGDESSEDGDGKYVEISSELNENSAKKDESEKTQNTTEEKSNEKTEETVNDAKGSNGNHVVEVKLDDGNNNVENSQGSKKDSVRRTRFSSEITIQPKAYFQAGAETVVMMPPSSTSDDVFKNDSHVVLNAEPSNSVLPQTFLPLTVFSCLFCCPMIGLFAVYKSYSVNKFIKKGDIRKAKEASQHARQLGVLTLFIGFFFVLAIVTIAVLVSTLT